MGIEESCSHEEAEQCQNEGAGPESGRIAVWPPILHTEGSPMQFEQRLSRVSGLQQIPGPIILVATLGGSGESSFSWGRL